MKRTLKKFGILYSLCLFLLAGVNSLFAQNYSIKLNIPDAGDSSIYLAHYFNGQIFVDDTIHLDQSGTGILKGDSLLEQGLYLIYRDKDHSFDFLVGKDQHLKINCPFSEPEKMKIKGSQDSELFNSYKSYLKELKDHQSDLLVEREKSKNDSVALRKLNDEIDDLNKTITDFWLSEQKKYPDLLYSKMIIANYVPTLKKENIPAYWLANDSLRWVYKYNFRKDHYWDYFDVADPRLLRTPFLRQRLETYFDKILIQTSDSVLPYAIAIIEKSKSDQKCFRYISTFLLDHFLQSKMMGMETVFVRIAEQYFLSGQASWADSDMIDKIKRQVLFKKNNLLGMKACDLKMESMDGPYYRLYDIDTDYTVLAFWEPECGHCKKQIPELYDEVFSPLKDKNVTFFLVCTQDNKNEWMNFINEHKLFDWINVWDPYNLNDFRINYDVQSTPMIYILDKDKKILAKKLDPEQVKKMLDYLMTGKM